MQLTSIDDAAWASPWRRRQVGEKAALSLGLVVSALVAPVWPMTPLVVAVSVVALLGPARVRPAVLLGVMAVPLVFILTGAASVALSVGAVGAASSWWQWGPLSVGRTSLLRALQVSAHAVAGSVAVMVLALTTPMVDLLTWARRWRVPDALVEIASLVYRMVFVLLATTVAIREAQRARLGDARRGWSGTWGRLSAAGDLTGSVLVHSWARARRLEEGLAGRGYESALVTLPVERVGSARFRWACGVTLLAVWCVVAAARLLGWAR